ncbi:MAG: efflux RND transporter periplasmic adaptor subunit [Gemmatimonadota bacterium]|nr:efflux RND transporter periplasmic adaptor subunit [Gemmatimonadota bacterium]
MSPMRERADRNDVPVRPPLARRWVAVIGVASAALIAVAIWAITASRNATNDDRAVPTEEGMAGMAGMEMTEGGSVRLTSDQVHQFGITFSTADVRPLTSEVRAAGAVTFDETKIAQVAAKFGGFVEKLHVNFTGQSVRRGQPLLEIFSPDLLAAQQELLLAADLQRDMGRSSVPGVPEGSNLVDAAKRRLRLWDISEAQIEEVLRAGRTRRTLTLYAPASGVVVEKNVVHGQAIAAGDHLYTIADLSEVWIDVQLREADAAAVRVGSGADVELVGLPGRAFKGRVEYVYPTLDQETRTVQARVAVTNTGGAVKPGMYATVRVTTPGRSALTVPNSAVLRTGERNVVFVDMGGGELMPHDVELGGTAGDYTEVLAGLEPGQRVVTSAQFLLDSESNLGEVMKAMMGQR